MNTLYQIKTLICCLCFTSLNAQFSSQSEINKILEIPVVFHLVLDNQETLDNVGGRPFKRALKNLTLGFNTINERQLDPNYQTDAASAFIVFKPSSELLGTPTTLDVTKHPTQQKRFSKYGANSQGQLLTYDKTLKQNGYVNSKNVLNIWICELKGSGGYSSFPQEQNPYNDGVVIDFKAFFSTSEITQKYILTHEVGHYLGLMHIWGKGECDGIYINQLCNSISRDDGISDTPAVAGPNTNKAVMQGKIRQTCDGSKLSNYQNWMDCAGVEGMFTKGQVKRMRENLLKFRAGLISNSTATQQVSISNNNAVTNTENYNNSICFDNPNFYGRRIELIGKNGEKYDLLIPQNFSQNKEPQCIYDIKPSVYTINVYTIFTKKRIETYQKRITLSNIALKLAYNGFN